jgi:hypothetical protein
MADSVQTFQAKRPSASCTSPLLQRPRWPCQSQKRWRRGKVDWVLSFPTDLWQVVSECLDEADATKVRSVHVYMRAHIAPVSRTARERYLRARDHVRWVREHQRLQRYMNSVLTGVVASVVVVYSGVHESPLLLVHGMLSLSLVGTLYILDFVQHTQQPGRILRLY